MSDHPIALHLGHHTLTVAGFAATAALVALAVVVAIVLDRKAIDEPTATPTSRAQPCRHSRHTTPTSEETRP